MKKEWEINVKHVAQRCKGKRGRSRDEDVNLELQ